DQRHGALAGFEVRLENERVRPVAARELRDLSLRSDAEAAVLLAAEQRREAGVGVEARPAQPVDRAVAADQRGALAVADQRIVLDASRHHANSITTLMSSLRCSNASLKRASGTRRVINRSSQ